MPDTNKFGKNFRLTTPQSFQRVFQNARRFRHLGISVLAIQNELASSRIGICIPKKQVPRSVDRNRIKRVIREAFRVKKNELSVNLDMVFLVYSALL